MPCFIQIISNGLANTLQDLQKTDAFLEQQLETKKDATKHIPYVQDWGKGNLLWKYRIFRTENMKFCS